MARRLPWYQTATPEQRRNLEAENWRRNIDAALFRAGRLFGGGAGADLVIERATEAWRKNPLGQDDRRADEEEALRGAPIDVQLASDRERAGIPTPGTQPVPGVPRGVAEAFPETVRRFQDSSGTERETRVYDSTTTSPTEVLGRVATGLDTPLASPEGLPGPARMLVEELTRPSNALLATGAPAAGLRAIPRVGGAAARLAEPTAGGFARRLITEAGASAGARTAATEVGEQLPEDTNPIVGTAAQLVAGLAGGAVGGAAAARAPQAATRYRDVTQNVPVGASVKPVDDAAEEASEEGPSVVARLSEIIRQAKPLRSQTPRMQSIERGHRAGEFGDLRASATGEAGAMAARRALAGELPKLQFESPRGVMEQPDIDELFDINRNFEWGPRHRFDQATVDAALVKTLSGQVPTRSEIKLLEKVYGPDLSAAILSKRPLGEKVREAALDAANIPRSLMASLDISGLLRQGGFLVGHPTRFAKTAPAYVRAMFSEKYAQAADEAIRSAPFAQELEDAGLYIAPRVGPATALTDREEAFMSSFVTAGSLKARAVKSGIGAGIGYASGDTEEERRRNALIGAGAGFSSPTFIKASERGYVTFLNKLRSDVAHDVMKGWDDQYREANIDRLARFVNAATGRGDLKEFGKSGPALNALFFSPRFLYSRFQLGAEGVRSVATLNDQLSRTIAKDTAAFVATGIGMMKLLEMSGQAEVELDPRSSDFGKVKIGPTRYDFWGGFQQIARYTAQLMTGERKTTTRGDIEEANRMETFGRFIQSKLAPLPGAAVDVLRGETMMGEELTATSDTAKTQAWNRLAPLFIQDLQEAAEEEGARGVIKTLPAGVGVGVTTFKSNQDIEREVAEQLFPGVPMEQMSREQLRAIRQSPEVQERLDASSGPVREQAQRVLQQQEHDDAQLQSGQLSMSQWEERRKSRKAEYSGFLLAQHGDELIQNPRNPYEEYLNVLRTSKDEGGQLDYERVEEWLNQQSPQRQAFIEARTGLNDTPFEAERRGVSDSLRRAGFFEIRDTSWEETRSRFKGRVREEAEQFASYDEYRTELVLQLAERLSTRMDYETAIRRAELTVDSHKAIANFEKRLRVNRARWAKANPELAEQAIQFGFLSPSELNLKASQSFSTSGRTPAQTQ